LIIDSHHHFWDPARGDYHWMPDASPILARHYGPNEFEPLLRKAGVTATVLVQAAQTEAETDYLLDIAAKTPFVLGVIGWLDMEAADFAHRLEHYRKNPFFLGLRPMLQDLDDDAWVLRPKVLQALRVVADAALPFEFLTFPRHLPHAVEASIRTPGLRALIDHASKPPIAAGEFAPWCDGMRAIASLPGAYCKLSGMVTEADHEKWRPADLAPYIDHVVNLFGPDRVMFGSDWPVCKLAAEYGEVVNALRTCLGGRLNDEELQRVFATNAKDFYRVSPDRLERARKAWI